MPPTAMGSAADPSPQIPKRDLDHRPFAGIALMLIAVGMFSTTDLMIKYAAPSVGTIEILFFRMVIGMLPLLPLMKMEAGSGSMLAQLQTKRLGMHTIRSFLALLFLTFYFVSVTLLPLADAYAIGFAGPLWVAALSVPMLGERVGPRRWAAIFVGLLGVLIILRPGGGVLSIGGLAGLAATMLFAISMIMIRTMSRTESSSAIAFYFQAYSILCCGLLLLAAQIFPSFGEVWGGFFAWRTPDTLTLWAMLIGIGLIGGIGQVCITLSYRHARAVTVTPFTYSSILWGLVYGIFLFNDIPSFLTLLGAGIVIASGIYIVFREAEISNQAGN